MSNVKLYLYGGIEYFDVCRRYFFIWFDDSEFESLPQRQQPASHKELSPEAKKMIAIAEVESIRRKQDFKSMSSGHPPDSWEELFLGITGMPVEYNTHYLSNIPVATYSIAAAMIIVTLLSFFDTASFIENLALIPCNYMRHFGLTFLTSFLLHGGIIHLISNLYFLVIFGDNVEDTLGIKNFLLLLGLSTLAGDTAHILVNPGSTIPVVGASGGISGILAYYCLRFPKARLGIIYWYIWKRIPVMLFLVVWIIGQVMGAIDQVNGFSNISAMSHLGGALVGIIFWLIFKFNSGCGIEESS